MEGQEELLEELVKYWEKVRGGRRRSATNLTIRQEVEVIQKKL